jgi:hypothetical protein
MLGRLAISILNTQLALVCSAALCSLEMAQSKWFREYLVDQFLEESGRS